MVMAIANGLKNKLRRPAIPAMKLVILRETTAKLPILDLAARDLSRLMGDAGDLKTH